MANTTNFAVEKPTVGGYRNTWGGTLNTGLDKLTELLALALPVGSIQMYPKTTAPTATTNGGTWLVCSGGAISRTAYADLFTVIGTTYGVGDGSSTFNIPDLRARVPMGYSVDGISGRTNKEINNTGGGAETHTLANTEIPKHTHPITDTGHTHPIAAQTHSHSGTTGPKTLAITDPGHYHSFTRINESGSGTYDTGLVNGGSVGGAASTDTKTTGITIADHDHSFSTSTDSANISTTATNLSGFTTTTTLQADGNGAHNIMQPYVVVNYIILAKHPTFS